MFIPVLIDTYCSYTQSHPHQRLIISFIIHSSLYTACKKLGTVNIFLLGKKLQLQMWLLSINVKLTSLCHLSTWWPEVIHGTLDYIHIVRSSWSVIVYTWLELHDKLRYSFLGSGLLFVFVTVYCLLACGCVCVLLMRSSAFASAFHIALNLAKYYALCFALFLSKCISLYFVNKEMLVRDGKLW